MDSYIFFVLFISAVVSADVTTHVLKSSNQVDPQPSTISGSPTPLLTSTTSHAEPKTSHHAEPKPSHHATTSHHAASSHSPISPSAHSSAAPMSSHAVPTTTPKPTTTSKPTTTPQPTADFELKKNGTDVCERIKGEITVSIHFSKSSKHNSTSIELVQDGADVSGHCLDTTNTSMMKVSWKGLDVVFVIKVEEGTWFLSQLNVNFTALNASATSNFTSASNDQLYQGQGNMSYECKEEKTLMLDSVDSQTYNITVDFKTIQIQPHGSNLNNSMTCPAKTDDGPSSSIVPIAVGCALAGLIVIVLIAYLIGRRKNNAGYQQV